MSRTSALQQFINLPTLSDASDITATGTTMADRIEKYVNMRFATAAARDAVITAPEQGMQVFLTTPQVMTWYDGTAWRGEWVTSFVPQIDQGATVNITKTVNFSEYRYDGPMIDFLFGLTLTGAGTAAAGATITLPVAMSSAAARTTGIAQIFDASASLRYIVAGESSSTTVINFPTDQTAGGGAWGLNPSIALAAGDVLRGAMRYRWI